MEKQDNKIYTNKNIKRNNLLNAGFDLFTEKGINETSIKEIADKAEVGKGTFYLYFKDKYDLHNSIIINKTQQLFHEAIEALEKAKIIKFDDQIIFIINYVIDELAKKPILLKLITKNLSIGIYNKKLSKLVDNNYIGIKEKFLKGIEENDIRLKNPEITLYMILELAGSTCFTCILKNEPMSMKEFKPYLYKTIKNMINEQ